MQEVTVTDMRQHGVDTCEALCVVASKLNNDHSLAAMRLSIYYVNHPSAIILDLALLMKEEVANP